MRKGIWPIMRASFREMGRRGITGFAKEAIQKVRHHEWSVYSEAESTDTAIMTRMFDFNDQDIERSNAVHNANPGTLELKEVNWFVPPFDNPYWGGVHTILRFADYFRAHKQVKNRLVVVGPAHTEEIRKKVARAFPNVTDEVYSVTSYDELDAIPAADAIVCSMWTTAYFALRFNETKRKFYFVQDFEPLFYPAGSTYAQAEATYRFGFFGIANTKTLADMYDRYGGVSTFFTPCVDTNIFYPSTRPVDKRPFTIFYYGRPSHPRNCFELGAQALKLVKKELGEEVRIVSAGAEWEPEEYGLKGIVEPLGMLDYEATAKLYRECDVGLSMMVTMHPSYIPLQLMASGCLVISNQNLYTSWLLKNQENCLLAKPSAKSLCNAILLTYHNSDLRDSITKKAANFISTFYSNWEPEMEKVFNYMNHPS